LRDLIIYKSLQVKISQKSLVNNNYRSFWWELGRVFFRKMWVTVSLGKLDVAEPLWYHTNTRAIAKFYAIWAEFSFRNNGWQKLSQMKYHNLFFHNPNQLLSQTPIADCLSQMLQSLVSRLKLAMRTNLNPYFYEHKYTFSKNLKPQQST
jgi:hypothetical protein